MCERGPSQAGLPAARPLEVGGITIACRDAGGDGPPILCLHETASSASVWEPLARELDNWARPIAYDRRGWGASAAPQGYRGTTVAEHAEDGAGVLAALGVEEAIACGAGFGSIAVLELMMRPGSPISAGVLIEPPLLSLLPESTEGLSADREAISAALESGGQGAAVELYLSGALPYLGPGSGRIPCSATQGATAHPLSLFAELAAVPAWALRGREMLAQSIPSRVVVGASTPPILRLAAEELAARLGGAEMARLGGEGLPHVSAVAGLAERIRSLL